MTAVNYAALRSVTGGHTIGQSYDLDIPLRAPDGLRVSQNRQGKEHISLSGIGQYVHHRVDVFYQCTTIFLTEPQRTLMAEFLDSVVAGEAFQFDPYGTSTVPASPLLVQLDGNYSVSRTHHSPALYQFVFKIRTVL